MADLIVPFVIAAILAHRLIFDVVLWAAGNVWSFVSGVYNRVRSIDNDTHHRRAFTVQVWVRVAEGKCSELDGNWKPRQLLPEVGRMRLIRQPGSEITLPVLRIDRLEDDEFGAQVPGAYLDVIVVIAELLDWVFHQLGYPDLSASDPPLPPGALM